VLAIPALSIQGLGSHWHVVASYLFLPAFNGGDYFPVLVAGWTLTFEMLFYFLFAAALALDLPLISFLSVTICLVAAGGAFVHPGGSALLRLFDPIVLEFLYGVLLGHAVRAKRLPRQSICLALLICGGATLMSLASYQSIWIRPFACGLPALAVVAGAVGLESYARGWLPLWILELGDSSYSLYLTHGLVIPGFVVFITRIRLTAPLEIVGMVALGMLVCIIVGELFYRLLELPMIRFFRGRRRAAVPVVG
jgi:exopolysaccharide production protein ExoZ